MTDEQNSLNGGSNITEKSSVVEGKRIYEEKDVTQETSPPVDRMEPDVLPVPQNAQIVGDQNTVPENVFRRHMKEDSSKAKVARHRLWLDTLQHEYPMPFVPYRIGVYIRFYNQTKYGDEAYLERHKAQFMEEIACCPRWTLVDFYVDKGSVAPGMEHSPEWIRLLNDCFAGKIDLIVTQKLSNATSDPQEIAFVARILAAQDPPIGIYFISEDIFTLASYYWIDMKDKGILPDGWKVLPPDELDGPMPDAAIMLEDTGGKEPEKVSITQDTGDMNADGEVV